MANCSSNPITTPSAAVLRRRFDGDSPVDLGNGIGAGDFGIHELSFKRSFDRDPRETPKPTILTRLIHSGGDGITKPPTIDDKAFAAVDSEWRTARDP
jgi:hypothetical protein